MNCSKKKMRHGVVVIIILQTTVAIIIWTKIRDTKASGKPGTANLINGTLKKQLDNAVPLGAPHSNDGFALAASAFSACASISKSNITGRRYNTMHYTPDGAVRFCPMAKIGSTFWRRVFYMVISKEKSSFQTPFDVPAGVAIGRKREFSHIFKRNNSEFSFLFVRNPLSRLLSTFIDKLVSPNPTFWNKFGKPAVTKFRRWPKGAIRGPIYGHDVTFTEFVMYATDMETSRGLKDEHIQSIRDGCHSCHHPYTYIGRMERFKDDAFYIMNKMGLEDIFQSMSTTFEQLADDDAISDTIYGPFTWKRSVTRYIPWEKALQRLWLKLQMRGLISKDKELKLTDLMVENMSIKDFIQLARKAHRESDPVKLKQQKELVKTEAFASVPLSVLKQFVNAFYDDFLLFGYDPFPSKYFNRDEKPIPPSIFFNYSHLN